MARHAVYVVFIGLFMGLNACSGIRIVQKPITFDATRKALSLQYLEERYGIEKKYPSIQPKMVVIHWTAIPTVEGTFETFDPPLLPQSRRGIAGASSLNVSSQYLIGRDGAIYQLLPDTVFARHVIGLNYCAIGVENVGNGSDLPLTDAQLHANIRLVKHLCKKYPIEYLIGHYEYTKFAGGPLWKEKDPNYRTVKTDPGEDFMRKLRHALKNYHLKGAPK